MFSYTTILKAKISNSNSRGRDLNFIKILEKRHVGSYQIKEID